MKDQVEQVELEMKFCPENHEGREKVKLTKHPTRQGWICPIDQTRFVLLQGDEGEPNLLSIYRGGA